MKDAINFSHANRNLLAHVARGITVRPENFIQLLNTYRTICFVFSFSNSDFLFVEYFLSTFLRTFLEFFQCNIFTLRYARATELIKPRNSIEIIFIIFLLN